MACYRYNAQLDTGVHGYQEGVWCAQVTVGSVEEAMEILKRSSRARQKAATALNYGSSRSHSIFSLAVFGAPDADDAASDAGV